MRKALSFIVIASAVIISCNKYEGKTESYITGDSWASDVKQALNCFIGKYGGSQNAYAVFDFDNTTSIFDIEEQLAVHQLLTMSFAVDSAGLREAISSGVDTNITECGYFIDDISCAYGKLCRTYGPFTPSGLTEEQQQTVHSDPQWKEFATKMRKMYDKIGEWTFVGKSYNWVLYWLTGMTPREVYKLSYDSHVKYSQVETSVQTWTSPEEIESLAGQVSVNWTSGIQVSSALKELWNALDGNGIDVWVCSASGLWQVLAAIDAFGLHSSCSGVLAMTISKDAEGKYIPEYDFDTGYGMLSTSDGWEEDIYPTGIQTAGPGKVAAILNSIAPHYDGHTPVAGFMDSTGDFNFCTEFKSLRLVVCFNRADRKITDGGGLIAEIAMYEKETLGYTFEVAEQNNDIMYLLQGRDENSLRTLRSSNKTIRYGTDEERLFANEDNYRQLQEIIDRNLTVGEAINEYSKAFLRSYNGYRSR